MIEVINEAWKWMQIEAKEIVAVNTFGNIIFSDIEGKKWRICPEELSCELIAIDDAGLADLMSDEAFKTDWEMEKLVDLAKTKLGDLAEGRVYCLKFPPVLGGLYDESNLGTITQEELIRFSGDMAYQIKDLPDGTKIKIDIEGLIP